MKIIAIAVFLLFISGVTSYGAARKAIISSSKRSPLRNILVRKDGVSVTVATNRNLELCLQNQSVDDSDGLDDDLSTLKLDESKLGEDEKQRLTYIKKISLEADDMIRDAGFSIDGEQDEEEIDKAIRDTNWSGQSNVEETTNSRNNYADLLSRKGLAIGDAAALVAFAAIGRGNHAEDMGLFADLLTAAPFLFSWFAVSPFLGSYSRSATASVSDIAPGLLAGWAVSVPLGLGIRGVLKGLVVPPTPFILVTLVATFTLLFSWRFLFVKAFGSTSDDEYKSAGFFEVFKMVGTLIKRW